MKARTGLLFSGMVSIFIPSTLLPASASDPPVRLLSKQEVKENVERAKKNQVVQDNIGRALLTLDKMKILLDVIEQRHHLKPDTRAMFQSAPPINATDQNVLNVILAEKVASNKEDNAHYNYHDLAESFRVVLEIEMPEAPPRGTIWYHLDSQFTYKSQLQEAYRDFQRKNKTRGSWKAFQPSTKDVFVADLRPVKAYKRNERGYVDEWKYIPILDALFSQARNYISCWRPGYSEDGQFALLKYETPGRFGSVEKSYFLQKQGEEWKILLYQSIGDIGAL